jgi:GlpG protein
VLGSRLERTIGSVRYLVFFAVAAFVSSSLELAASDDTGIGASGVVYGIFGLMWIARSRVAAFREVLDGRVVGIFLVWLVGCVVVTFLDIWTVGNVAHVSGLLVGVVASALFLARYRPRLMRACLVGILFLAAVPLVWCPWSPTWLSVKAYDAHVGEEYERALDLYSRVIRMEPENAWAYENRALVHEALSEPEKARDDLRRAREIDPSIEDRE